MQCILCIFIYKFYSQFNIYSFLKSLASITRFICSSQC